MSLKPLSIPRDLLGKYFKDDPRLIAHFEDQSLAVAQAVEVVDGTVTATDQLQDATVITLSANSVFNNEFLLINGDGTEREILPGTVSIKVDKTVARVSQYSATFVAPADVTLFLPVEGELLSTATPATVYNKTLVKPTLQSPVIIHGLNHYDTDAEAAAGGVPIDGLYRDGNVVCVRRT